MKFPRRTAARATAARASHRIAPDRSGASTSTWYLIAVGWLWGEAPSALVVALLAVASPDRAAAANVTGSYRAPEECPSQAAWRATLRARGDRELGFVVDRLAIEIERRGEGAQPSYEGRIRSSGTGAPSRGRRVRGATCPEVLEALTLIARLGVARASTEPPGRAASEAPAGSGASAESSAPVESSRGDPAWALSAADELELARDPPQPVDPSRATGSVRFSAAALAIVGGAARAAAGADLGVTLAARWASVPLQPLLLVGVYGGGERFRVPGTGAGARLERLALHAAACPLRFPRGAAAFGLRPCVDVDAGVLRGSGVSVDAARGHDAPWLSAGLQLRGEWSPWGPIELGAMLGGVVALSRPRFYFVPDTTAFQADAVALRAAASAGVSF